MGALVALGNDPRKEAQIRITETHQAEAVIDSLRKFLNSNQVDTSRYSLVPFFPNIKGDQNIGA
jgi:hypothetical protein